MIPLPTVFRPAWFFPAHGSRNEPRVARLAIVTSQYSDKELNLHVLNHAVYDCHDRNMDGVSVMVGVTPVTYAREVHPSLPFCVLTKWDDVMAGKIPDPWDTGAKPIAPKGLGKTTKPEKILSAV